MKHRWSNKTVFPNKSERECQNNCGIIKVTRHETEGGKDTHFVEFYRGLDRISRADGRTPVCEPVGADA